MKSKYVIAYVRVSTDAQAKEDKFGVEAQRKQIEDYAWKNGLSVVKWVEDLGESGAKERPGFDSLVYGECQNPPYEAVVVAKSDRVARDINVYYYYKMMLLKKGVQLLSVAEDFGQMGMFAPMLEAFTLCVAQMERDNITKRTSSGRRVKAAKGGYSGGKPPMGYKAVNGQLVIDEEEAVVVRFILRCKAMGYSMLGTRNKLNDLGMKTRSGKEFQISSVQRIWSNEMLYRGYYKYGKTGLWVPGQHEPLLPSDEEEEEE